MSWNIAKVTTTRVYEVTVTGVEPITKPYAPAIRLQPDTARVVVRDGEVTEVAVAGPRLLKSGKLSGPERVLFGSWSMSDAPEWVQDLADEIGAGK